MLAVTTATAQEAIIVDQGCGFSHPVTSQKYFITPPSKEAVVLVEELISILGLSQNYILKSANCEQVIACTSNNKRYLLYNPEFLIQMDQYDKNFEKLGVWIHQIGHHINGHDFDSASVENRIKEELEADRVTGFVMFRLLAYEEEASACTNYIIKGESNPFYPNAILRKEAISDGWKLARGDEKSNEIANDIVQNNNNSNWDYGDGNHVNPSMLNFLNAKFPFPPPQCHTSYELPKTAFSDCKILGEVASKISSALEIQKYPYKFMSVPDGLAIVAQMEQYNQDGTLLENNSRWQDIPKSEASIWSLDYFKNLIFPNKCDLRVFVFLVVNENWSSDKDKRISKEAAEAWYREGVNRLPKEIIEKPLTSDYGISLLLYEFEVPEANHSPKQNCPCKFQALKHFEMSGLKEALANSKGISNLSGQVGNIGLNQKLTGLWGSQWNNESGELVSNRVLLNTNHTLIAESYINGALTTQTTNTWEAENGYFIETNIHGIYYKYQLEFQGKNIMMLKFLETNGLAAFPLGTIFTYTRL